MKYVFLLSGDYPDLAKEEAFSLFEIKNYKILDRLLIADLNNDEKSLIKLGKISALTKKIYRLLFQCKLDALTETMKDFDWSSFYKDNFCLRVHNLSDNGNKKGKIRKNYSEKELAGYVWNSLHNAKVNLENPKTLIQLFLINGRAYCGLLLFQNNENFELRKSHLRPFPHPSSLHPKAARALVNITGIKEAQALLDPFCGTGGFLIEAGLMGIKTIGYDINKVMAKGCIENLKYFKIRNCKVKIKNSLHINDKFDFAVTDLPYGLNSNAVVKYGKDWKKFRLNKKIQKKDFIGQLEKFYLSFLKNLRSKLSKKAVIIFPDYVDYKKLLRQAKFKVEREFKIYVHRSLTRKIVRVS